MNSWCVTSWEEILAITWWSFTWKEKLFQEGSWKLKLWNSVMRRNSTQILIILAWKGWSFPLQIYIFKNVKNGHLKILDIDQKQLKKSRNIYSLKQMDFYLKTGEFVNFFLPQALHHLGELLRTVHHSFGRMFVSSNSNSNSGWNPSPLWDGIGKWVLWKLIGFRLVHNLW